MSRPQRLAYGTALALLTVLALFLAAYGQSPGAPDAGTVNRTATFTLADSEFVSGTTGYTDAPNLQTGGADASRVDTWNSTDVFINADVALGTLTATVQFSPDASLWADSEFDFVDSSGAIAQGKHQRTFAADGTALLRVPAAGQHIRLSLEASGQATATVKAMHRNN